MDHVEDHRARLAFSEVVELWIRRLDIFREVQPQGGRCFILGALEGRQKVVAQGGSPRAGARTLPWVSVPANSSLPPNRPPFGRFGGRGGHWLQNGKVTLR